MLSKPKGSLVPVILFIGLGWAPIVGFKEGLARTYAAFVKRQ